MQESERTQRESLISHDREGVNSRDGKPNDPTEGTTIQVETDEVESENTIDSEGADIEVKMSEIDDPRRELFSMA